MSERENRREEILEAAGDFFVRRGYAGTSTQQIADAVGCSKAALYYHFKDGKSELYKEVLKTHSPDLAAHLAKCEAAVSLKELIVCFGTHLFEHAPERMDRIRWMIAEFPQFSELQRDIIRDRQVWLVNEFSGFVQKFVADAQEAKHITLLAISAMVGYQLMFVQTGTAASIENSLEEHIESIADYLAQGR